MKAAARPPFLFLCTMAFQTRKIYTLEDAAVAIERYCAYQERCQQEVKRKLFELGMHGAAADELLSKAISEKWVNEDRFAQAYAGGKFRSCGWGKNKIQQGLLHKGVNGLLMERALASLDEEEYAQKATQLVLKKWEEFKKLSQKLRWQKTAVAIQTKGFEKSWMRVIQVENENE